MTARGSKVIRLVLPSIALTDSRPGVSANRALVLTTNHVVDGEQVSGRAVVSDLVQYVSHGLLFLHASIAESQKCTNGMRNFPFIT